MKFRWKSILRDIIPRRTLRDGIPPLPQTASPHGRVKITPEMQSKINYLMVRRAARTTQDAARLLRQYPELSVRQIAKRTTPRRRRDRVRQIARRLIKWL